MTKKNTIQPAAQDGVTRHQMHRFLFFVILLIIMEFYKNAYIAVIFLAAIEVTILTGLCIPGCENGGTCVGTNDCSCSYGYQGLTCSKPSATSTILPRLNSLSVGMFPLFAYWPLTLQTALRDSGPNAIHGYWSDGQPEPTFMTISNANGGWQQSGNVTARNFMVYNSAMFPSALNGSSFTMTTWVYINPANQIGPILEFSGTTNATSFQHACLWFTGFNSTYGNLRFRISNSTVFEEPCTLTGNGWNFIGIAYNATTSQSYFVCNNNTSPLHTSPIPSITPLLYQGFSTVGNGTALKAVFACTSIYLGAMTLDQATSVKSMCELYQGLASFCSPNCATSTCRVNTTAVNGYSCSSCNDGWSGDDCTIPTTQASATARIQQLENLLPPKVAYWPLTGHFGLRDAGVNLIDGSWQNSIGTLVDGPSGKADSAWRTSDSENGTTQFIAYTSDLLNFANTTTTSWTWSTWIRFDGVAAMKPIFQFNATNTLYLYTMGTTHVFIRDNSSNYIEAPCNVTNGWNFIAVGVKKQTNQTIVYCNNFISLGFGVFNTAPTFLLGYGNGYNGILKAVKASFACTSIYSDFLVDELQLEVVRDLCSLYQNITCSPNCVADSCRVDLTSPNGYSCSCNLGWIGSDCNTHSSTGTSCRICNPAPIINDMKNTLPAQVAFWPLTDQFGLRDASGNMIDGYWTNATGQLVDGPNNKTNSAWKTGDAANGTTKYIAYNSALLNFGHTNSWTLSTWVNFNSSTATGPILEYAKIPAVPTQLSGIKTVNTTDMKFYGGLSFGSSCDIMDSAAWIFLAAGFKKETNEAFIYCNDNLATFANANVSTSSILLQGFSNRNGNTKALGVSHACTAIYSGALSLGQLQTAKDLCSYYQRIKCSPNCVPDSCRVDLQMTNGFRCSACLPGWGTDDCSTKIENNNNQVATLNTSEYAQSSLLAYYPLTAQFGLRDSTVNKIDGIWNGAIGSPVPGPNSMSRTAWRTGTTNETKYISYTSPMLKFQNTTSWTLATWVNFNGNTAGPILEWANSSSPSNFAQLWQFNGTEAGADTRDALYFFSGNNSGAVGTTVSCFGLSNYWTFVAVTYTGPTGTMSMYCNDQLKATFASHPITTNTLLQGFRSVPNSVMGVPASFACTSVHSMALTELQVGQLKMACQYYQKLICSPNCVPNTCRANLTVPFGYMCTCQDGWGGSGCLKPVNPEKIAAVLRNTLANLPPQLVYWPLTAQFGLRDAGPNVIDGFWLGSSGTSVVGPSGKNGTGWKTGQSTSTPQYISFNSTNLVMNMNRSWTLTTWVNFNGHSVGPIFEWTSNTNSTLYSRLWQYDNSGQGSNAELLYFSSCSNCNLDPNYSMAENSFSCPGLNNSDWHFVGVGYNMTTNLMTIICDSSISYHSWAIPLTTPVLLQGFRENNMGNNSLFAVPASFACTSIFLAALDYDQLATVASLCDVYQSVRCTNCVYDTCRIDVTQANAYNCGACNAGWIGADCSISIASMCQHSGNYIAANGTCNCTGGWQGANCTVPVCSMVCQNGGTCIQPNVCSCPLNTTGSVCDIIIPILSGTQSTMVELFYNFSMVAYWPLSMLFLGKDVSGHVIDGSSANGYYVEAPGPSCSSCAIKVNSSSNSRLSFNSSMVNLGTSSWTIAGYVNVLTTNPTPLFSYFLAGSSQTLVIGANNGNRLLTEAFDDHPTFQVDCSMQNIWQFIAISYNNQSHTLRAFCKDSFVYDAMSFANFTASTNHFDIGYSEKLGSITADAKFACVSIFKTNLDQLGLLKVRQLCQPIQSTNCSSNCVYGTCRFNSNTASGFTCTCQAGWTGYVCDIATNTTNTTVIGCQNGGTFNSTSGTCHCATLWQGANCTIPLCSTPCQNGGTCIQSDVCSCPLNTTGSFCNTTISMLDGVQHTMYDLSSMVAYWPLSWQFDARDASSNWLDGSSAAGNGTFSFTTGPSGSANCAMQLHNATNNHLSFQSSMLNLNATSWTIAGYVNVDSTTMSTPLFSYFLAGSSNTTTIGASNGSQLFMKPYNGSATLQAACNMQNVWQFVAVTYNNQSGVVDVFCNNEFLGSAILIANYTASTNHFDIGFSVSLGSTTADAKFACVSVYKSNLYQAQLLKVKQLCQPIQSISCSPNCEPSTCRFSSADTSGYRCTCKSGWSGSICDIANNTTNTTVVSCENGGTFNSTSGSCHCSPGWQGANCTTPVCVYGCANGGTCIAPITCVCAPGWNGTACSTAVCSMACQNGGTCTAPNTCLCTSDFSGSDCTTSAVSCGGYYCQHGATCVSNYYCSCVTGWAGLACENANCTSPCQHGGSCTSPDVCTCTSTWTGATCSTPYCLPDCGIHGTCIEGGPNYCNCSAGYTHSSNYTRCDMPICSSPCLNGGTCSAPDICACPAGWTGNNCATPICNLTCLSGGTCTAPYTCTCTAHWSGAICNIPICSPACSSIGGSCSAQNVCACYAGYTGTTCSQPVCTSPCQNGGTCSAPDTCGCVPGWQGTDCSIEAICDPPCLNGAICNNAANTCSCLAGWTGQTCATAICTKQCTGNGVCTAPDVCTCSSGWTGPTCAAGICAEPCLNGGTCSSPNICTCADQWFGSSCNKANCSSCMHGECVAPETCSCKPGWTGKDCNSAICSSVSCENGGTCVLPDKCSCVEGWEGVNCTITHCSPECVHGSCVGPNKCSCDGGWAGTACQLAVCSVPCGNGGSCTSPDKCTCAAGFTGLTCLMPISAAPPDNNTQLIQSAATMSFETLTVNLAAITQAFLVKSSVMLQPQTVSTTSSSGSSSVPSAPSAAEQAELLSNLGLVSMRISSMADSLSADQLANVTKSFVTAADQTILSAAQTALVETENAVKSDHVTEVNDCQKWALDESRVSSETLSNEQLDILYASFKQFLKGILGGLKTSSVKASSKATTFNGQFYNVVVQNLRLNEVSGIQFGTEWGTVHFPDLTGKDPSDMVMNKLLPKLPAGSEVTVVMSTFLANVMNAEQPLNLPTISLQMFYGQYELALNPGFSVTISTKAVPRKAQLFAKEKYDATCDVSRVKCDLTSNADSLGSLATFPLKLGAGDFIVSMPIDAYPYSAYISFRDLPTNTIYTWRIMVSKLNATVTVNDTYGALKYSFSRTTGVRAIISSKAIYNFISLNTMSTSSSLQMHVFLKRNFSAANIHPTDDLPEDACTLQRVEGYHLRIVNAEKSSNTQSRKKRQADASGDDDSLSLELDSTESNVAFTSQYFGSFGADLVIVPNTIEFSTIFANFSNLVADNAAVLAVIVTVVGIFMFTVIFLHILDKRDLKNWAFLPIRSNEIHQTSQYLVSVHCSETKNCHLKPIVDIRLFGNVQTTEWRPLDDGMRDNFKANRPSNFVLTTYFPVGRIGSIELSVKSRLREAGNILAIRFDKVVIVDVARCRKYIFLMKSKLQAGQSKQRKLATEDEINDFIYLITGNTKATMKDSHPWLSIIQRPLPSHWTRAERLGTVVAAIFMAMLVNAMFYGQDAASPRIGVKVGNLFRISWFTLWTSLVGCLVIIPPTSIIALIFQFVNRRSAERSHWATIFNIKLRQVARDHEEDDDVGQETRDLPKKPFQLPYFSVIFAWLLVGASVGVSAFIVIMYSLTWGQEKSLQWLSGMIIYVIQDVLLIQTGKVLLLSIFNSSRLQIPEDGLNVGRLTLTRDYDGSRTAVFKRFRTMVVGLGHHTLYVILFALVIGTTRNEWGFTAVKAVKRLASLDGYGIQPMKGLVPDRAFIFDYLQGQIIPNFLSGNQLRYGGMFPGEKLLAVPNSEIILIGAVRIRQQRAAEKDCQIQHSVVQALTDRFARQLAGGTNGCTQAYTNDIGLASSSEQRNFDGSWAKMLENVSPDTNWTTFQTAWLYRQVNAPFFTGEQAMYDNGGYYVDLPTTKAGAIAVIQQLKAARWLDNATISVFVDFNIYNAQINIFTPVKVVFEGLVSGGMTHLLQTNPLQLYQYSGADSVVTFLLQAIWIILLITHIAVMIHKICKLGFRDFRRNYWNVFEMVQLMLGVVIVALFAVRIVVAISTIEEMRSQRSSYTSLDSLVNWEEAMFNIYGFALFFTLMTFFRHLASNKFWSVCLATFSKGRNAILSYVALFLIVSICTAAFFNLTVGDRMWPFSTYKWSFYSLVSRYIGGTTSQITKLGFPDNYTKLVSLIYSEIVNYIGASMFLAIIGNEYGSVNSNAEVESGWDAELAAYIHEELRKLLSFKNHDEEEAKEKPKDGDDVPLKKPLPDKTFKKLNLVVDRFAKAMDKVRTTVPVVEDQKENECSKVKVDHVVDRQATKMATEQASEKVEYSKVTSVSRRNSSLPPQRKDSAVFMELAGKQRADTPHHHIDEVAVTQIRKDYMEYMEEQEAVVEILNVVDERPTAAAANVRSSYGERSENRDVVPKALSPVPHDVFKEAQLL